MSIFNPKQSIRSRVMQSIENKIKEKQTLFNDRCASMDKHLEVNIKNHLQMIQVMRDNNENSKEELANEIVIEILG